MTVRSAHLLAFVFAINTWSAGPRHAEALPGLFPVEHAARALAERGFVLPQRWVRHGQSVAARLLLHGNHAGTVTMLAPDVAATAAHLLETVIPTAAVGRFVASDLDEGIALPGVALAFRRKSSLLWWPRRPLRDLRAANPLVGALEWLSGRPTAQVYANEGGVSGAGATPAPVPGAHGVDAERSTGDRGRSWSQTDYRVFEDVRLLLWPDSTSFSSDVALLRVFDGGRRRTEAPFAPWGRQRDDSTPAVCFAYAGRSFRHLLEVERSALCGVAAKLRALHEEWRAFFDAAPSAGQGALAQAWPGRAAAHEAAALFLRTSEEGLGRRRQSPRPPAAVQAAAARTMETLPELAALFIEAHVLGGFFEIAAFRRAINAGGLGLEQAIRHGQLLLGDSDRLILAHAITAWRDALRTTLGSGAGEAFISGVAMEVIREADQRTQPNVGELARGEAASEPIVTLARSICERHAAIEARVDELVLASAADHAAIGTWIKAQHAYPDANGTLRVSAGVLPEREEGDGRLLDVPIDATYGCSGAGYLGQSGRWLGLATRLSDRAGSSGLSAQGLHRLLSQVHGGGALIEELDDWAKDNPGLPPLRFHR